MEVKLGEYSYFVKIEEPKSLPFTDKNSIRFFSAYKKELLKLMKFSSIRTSCHFHRNYFKHLKEVDMVVGFFNSIKIGDEHPYLLLNSTLKFFQQCTVLDEMQDYSEEDIKNYFVGKSCMTTYNFRTYRIDGVDFTQTPSSKFYCTKAKINRHISYEKYLLNEYGVKGIDRNQCLLKHINERTGQTVYLVPQLCVLRGVNDAQKLENMKVIKPDLFANAQKKAEHSSRFFKTLKLNKEKYKEHTDQWKIKFSEEALEVQGYE